MNRPITFMNCEETYTWSWDTAQSTGQPIQQQKPGIQFKVKKSKIGNGNLVLEVSVDNVVENVGQAIRITENNHAAIKTALEMFETERSKIQTPHSWRGRQIADPSNYLTHGYYSLLYKKV